MQQDKTLVADTGVAARKNTSENKMAPLEMEASSKSEKYIHHHAVLSLVTEVVHKKVEVTTFCERNLQQSFVKMESDF